jgi:hypothetical protein
MNGIAEWSHLIFVCIRYPFLAFPATAIHVGERDTFNGVQQPQILGARGAARSSRNLQGSDMFSARKCALSVSLDVRSIDLGK